MATTANGTPYVESSDLVANYPAVSLALAEHLDDTVKVLQVVSATKVDTFSTSSTSFVDVTGLSVSITPASASNTILVFLNVGAAHSTNDTNNIKGRLMRDSTPIGVFAGGNTFIHYGTDNSHDPETYSMNILDAPATSASTVYKLQVSVSANTGYINRSRLGASALTVSSITVMEVAA